jgi:hypothetical protein
MSARTLFLGSVILLPLLAVHPARAQRVDADIRIGGGPIAGRIVIGSDGGRYDERYGGRPRGIRYVEIIRGRDHGRDNRWFRKLQRQARVVVVFYDRRDDRYYLDRYRGGLQEIRIYERDGRFYRLDEDWNDDRRNDRYDHRRDDH